MFKKSKFLAILLFLLYGSLSLSGVASAVDLKSLKVGDTFTFGHYEQDNNSSNGKEPIEWLVLDRKGDEVLIISKYVIDSRPYGILGFISVIFEGITWEKCDLRKWLNSDFINAAFDSKEQGKILRKKIKNLNNPKYNTDGGNDTDDKVFLLSIGEAIRYFPTNESRITRATPYVICKDGFPEDIEIITGKPYGGDSWCLRSPGYFKIDVAHIDCATGNEGGISYAGGEADSPHLLRPALWLNISK